MLFESLVVRDLRIYAALHDAELSHYRDSGRLEVDAVIETAAGAWLPVEVKLASAGPHHRPCGGQTTQA